MRHPLEIEMDISAQLVESAKISCEFGQNSVEYAQAEEKLEDLYEELDFAKSHGDTND